MNMKEFGDNPKALTSLLSMHSLVEPGTDPS